jgi:hypothetical protein
MFASAAKVPSPDALAASAAVAARVRNREAQVRRVFIERKDVTAPTPLVRMLRGGRGGSVRLRLYLSLLWFAANPPYDVTYPARAWAQLLDLRDYENAGARRITDAFTWLAKEGFVEVDPRPGLPSMITVLNESGTKAPYSIPGAMWRTLAADAAPAERDAHRYVRLPATFWTSGWIAVLSAPAIAMYLVLLAELAGDDPAKRRLWLSPREADLRYGISEDTRSTGLRELVDAGLVRVERQTVNPDAFDFRRMRNVYRLRPARLEKPAHL